MVEHKIFVEEVESPSDGKLRDCWVYACVDEDNDVGIVRVGFIRNPSDCIYYYETYDCENGLLSYLLSPKQLDYVEDKAREMEVDYLYRYFDIDKVSWVEDRV